MTVILRRSVRACALEACRRIAHIYAQLKRPRKTFNANRRSKRFRLKFSFANVKEKQNQPIAKTGGSALNAKSLAESTGFRPCTVKELIAQHPPLSEKQMLGQQASADDGSVFSKTNPVAVVDPPICNETFGGSLKKVNSLPEPKESFCSFVERMGLSNMNPIPAIDPDVHDGAFDVLLKEVNSSPEPEEGFCSSVESTDSGKMNPVAIVEPAVHNGTYDESLNEFNSLPEPEESFWSFVDSTESSKMNEVTAVGAAVHDAAFGESSKEVDSLPKPKESFCTIVKSIDNALASAPGDELGRGQCERDVDSCSSGCKGFEEPLTTIDNLTNKLVRSVNDLTNFVQSMKSTHKLSDASSHDSSDLTNFVQSMKSTHKLSDASSHDGYNREVEQGMVGNVEVETKDKDKTTEFPDDEDGRAADSVEEDGEEPELRLTAPRPKAN